jgi:maleate isomerase
VIKLPYQSSDNTREAKMRDTLGFRMKFGIVTPSANSVVQPEYDAMRPPGVTNNVFRTKTPNSGLNSEADWITIVRQIDEGIEDGVDQAMTCDPGHLILGVSIESVWDGGIAASERIGQRIERRAANGIKVTQATQALPEALKAYGVGKRVALVTPYFPEAGKHASGFVEEIGFQVVRSCHMAISRPSLIAQTKERDLHEALRSVNGSDVDVIVQFGANLPMMAVAAEAEKWLEKPVIAINAATYWYALRRNGIDDKVYGCGRLLAEY